MDRFIDRKEAGRRLGALVARRFRDHADVLVLGLPRGGVPVAHEVARALGAPLDVLVVRKLGVPGHEELAMGAIARGVRVLNEDIVAYAGVDAAVLARVAEREEQELERREQAYRGERPAAPIRGRHVVVVDDGLATGATMRAAVVALRAFGPASITAAVPVGSLDAERALRAVADHVVLVYAPASFGSVGEWYRDFRPTSDDEVRALLAPPLPPASAAVHAEPAAALLRHALPLRGLAEDWAPLAPLVHDARVVLVGETSHGTHEHYAERARLTRWLLDTMGFTDVAAEADWPDALRVTRFVRGGGGDADPEAALGDFERFPRWMWRNVVVRDFVGWLRSRNDALPAPERAGFFGLDLYSLHRSMQAVVDYLAPRDPAAAARARARYACFDVFGDDPQRYAFAVSRGAESCEAEVAAQLVELGRRAGPVDPADDDERFFAEENARLARDAEEYYRAMFEGSVVSWNLRDRHMASTLGALLHHLDRRRGRPARLVVWAHNSHLGDARATHRARHGELNLGQLVREQHGTRAVLVGQTTYEGTVSAARDWGRDVERRRVRPAPPDSHEAVLHATGLERFLVVLRDGGEAAAALHPWRVERAIGVVYRPETERQSHCFGARLSDQFDVVLHTDRTGALEPLDRSAGYRTEDPPETYPSGV